MGENNDERTFFPQPGEKTGKFTPLTMAPRAVTCCCVTSERGQWTGRGLVQGEGTQGETKGGDEPWRGGHWSTALIFP